MTKRSKYILAAAGILVTLLLCCATILPVIVRSKALSALEEATGRKVRIEAVSINPLSLAVSIKGFAIAEKGGAPLVAFREVRASLAPASIYKRALILSQVTIDTPTFSFSRTGPNRYSFSDIVDRQAKAPQKEKSGGFLFSLNNITVRNGSLDFDDRTVGGGRQHTVRALDLAVPFVSNIPYLAEEYINPRLSAVVNGAPFKFYGKLKPLSKSLETSVHLGLKQLNLPRYVAYSPVKPAADLTSGTVTIGLDVSYRISAERKPQLRLDGSMRLDDIAVKMASGEPLAKFSSLQAKAAGLEIFRKSFAFDSINLEGLELFVSRDRNGEWMYSRLLPKSAEAPQEKKPGGSDGNDAVFSVATLSCSDGTVHFRDALPAGGFETTVTELDLSVNKFSTAQNTAAAYELSFLMDKDASFDADGTFALAPLAFTSSASVTGLKIQRAYPYLARQLGAPVKGTLEAAAELQFSKAQGLLIDDGSLLLKDLSARYAGKEGLDLARLQVADASFHQKENLLTVGDVHLSGGGISLSRQGDGQLSPLSLMVKQAQPAAPAGKLPAKKQRVGRTAQKTQPLNYHLKHFRLDSFNLAFTDRSLEDEPRFSLRNINLDLSNLKGPKFAPASLRFSSGYGKNATLKASGAVTPAPLRYRGRVSVGRLPIRDFEAYFPDTLNFYVIGGSVDTTMNLDVALRGGKPSGTFSGSAGVRGFHSVDALDEEDLLTWESLQFDEVRGDISPFKLNVHQVALNDVYSRVIIRKDGSLNLQGLVEEKKNAVQPAPAGSAVAAPVQAPPTRQSAPPAPRTQRQISIGSITVQDGTMAFSDYHMPQTFSSTFYNLGGRVSGLTSEESKFADVDLRGNLDNHSPMQITGRLNPLRDDLFVDLKVSFRDVDLSPATPYSGTYLGYAVDKGKLYLDLKYLIERKQLTSQNKIFIDQFSFGKKVDSKEATGLPVHLAVALLKDRKGEIHLDVPVTGRTDDPQFSIWRLVGQVLKNLLVKAATSPFALLSSMMGNGQDFSVIEFTAGSSALSAAEEQKLGQFAKVLADRPGLKIEMKGFVDKGRDAEGYRQELLSRKLRNEKFLLMVKEQQNREGEGADTVQVSAEEYPRFLKAVYKKEKFPKPRNALGLVKDLPDAEMKKLIVANTVVGENELLSLARERSAAVMNYLVAKGNVPAERLFQKNEDIHKAPVKEGASRTRVEFNAIVH